MDALPPDPLSPAPAPTPAPSPPVPAATGAPGAGHRARLRARLLGGGPDALHDHEIVEYLLALAIPRRDTKPLAKALIARFGSFARVMSADPATLAQVDGMGDGAVASLKIVQAAVLRLLKSEAAAKPALASWQGLLDYLRADMAFRTVERVRVLHLNAKNMLIGDEVVSEGSIDQSAIYVREVVRRALELGSTALILVHNHPSGDPQPSKQDIAITRELIEAGRRFDIAVHDHVIIAENGHASLRQLGLI